METAVIKYLADHFDLKLPEQPDQEQLVMTLAEKINYLIVNNFTQLVRMLYRIDVSEQKLKTMLRQNPQADAGRIIASMIIERQLEKIRSRKNFRENNIPPDGEEKW
jgi:hypothetical protein